MNILSFGVQIHQELFPCLELVLNLWY